MTPSLIKLDDNKYLVTGLEGLPKFQNAEHLYLDFETTSFDPTVSPLDPFQGHRVCGIAVTADECPDSYYVPIRHLNKDGSEQEGNLPLEPVQKWLKSIVETCENWTNANVKFDAHFARFEGCEFQGRLVCLTTAAKVLNADMAWRGGYGLKNLCKVWLGHDIDHLRDEVREYLDTIKLPKGKKCWDYGLVPIDIMAVYATEDALSARSVYKYIKKEMPESCLGVWETEIKLTPVLYDMEVEGLRVDINQLRKKEIEILQIMMGIEEKLEEVLGFSMNPARSADCHDLINSYWALPILAWNEITAKKKSPTPSYDKYALISYAAHPDIRNNPVRTEVLKLVQKYRKIHTLLTLFVRPYQAYQVDGLLHSDYNQSVKSARMSCSRPNAQQLNTEAKELIHPKEGKAFLSCDYAQVEYRLIVHYTHTIEAIEAYLRDPDTDFHMWVADMCQIPRKPAKNINFAIAFGALKKKVTNMLSGMMELMKQEDIEGLSMSEREAYCKRRAVEVFDKYHAAVPGLAPVSNSAKANARSRGYVFNAYGRRLHLPTTHAYRAFNRVVQSLAADIMKERTVALAPRYNKRIRELGLKLVASVHDETLLEGDPEVTSDPAVIDYVASVLEDVVPSQMPLRVPIRTSAGWSDFDWATAAGDAGELDRKNNWQKQEIMV